MLGKIRISSVPKYPLGFTGTQDGMTQEQRQALHRLLCNLDDINMAHHGDCIGADAQFHTLCLEHNIPITIHPPDNPRKRAFCKGASATREPLPYLLRNRQIVLATPVLIATPKEFEEVLRSGTWSTVRFARKKKRKIYLILPDGDLSR